MNTAEPPDASLTDRSSADEPLARFDPHDPAFIADPQLVLAGLRDAAPIVWYEPSGERPDPRRSAWIAISIGESDDVELHEIKNFDSDDLIDQTR